MNPSDAQHTFAVSPRQVFSPVSGPAICEVELSADIDAQQLARAIEQVLRRYPMLTARYEVKGQSTVGLFVDWSHFAFGEPVGGFRADLTQGSEHALLRLSLAPASSDALSLRMLVEEIRVIYDGNGALHSDEAVQYEDVGPLLEDLLHSDEFAAGRAFWQNQAQPAPLSFPFALRSDAYAPASARANQLVEADDALLLTCWAHLLGRLSASRELSIGVCFDGRSYDEIKDVQGAFALSLPLPISLNPTATTRECVARIGALVEERQAYQDYFAPQPSQAITFAAHDLNLAKPGWRLLWLNVPHTRCELGLVCLRTNAGVRVCLNYDRGHFEPAHMDRLLEQFLTLLGEAKSADSRQMDHLKLVGSKEWREVRTRLSRLSDTRYEVPVHRLFEEQVSRTPEAVALAFGDETTSYQELNHRANQLAAELIRRGAGPEVRVALCLERSLEMVIAVLATLKSGAVYVPLNGADPQERLKTVLDDSDARILLTDEARRMTFAGTSATFLCLDSWAFGGPIDNPRDRAALDNTAYMIYTSGTSGKPKGVMIPHRGLCNYLGWAAACYLNDRQGSVPMFAPIAFDMSVTSLFLPLISGITSELLPAGSNVEILQSLAKRLIAHDPINFVKVTPSHLEGLARLIEDDQLIEHRLAFIIGGEALTYETLSFWKHHAPNARFFNEYGPTETVVGCSVRELVFSDQDSGAAPIGSPIENTELFITDSRLNPTPTGCMGALFVAGLGVGRGYLGRPRQTAEAFIPNPFSAVPGDRLYRTGDWVRLNFDDTLTYHGRIDQQIKIRGYRVEIGEIEVSLMSLHAVKEAAVLFRDSGDGEHELVAFIVPSSAECNSKAIASLIAERLPEYMVPSAICQLDTLPLTDNGKIDRKALAELPITATESSGGRKPKDPVETLLAMLWADVTNQDPDASDLDIEKPFFEQGAHSLVLIMFISRVRTIFGIAPDIRDLFKNGSVSRVSAELAAKEKEPGMVTRAANALLHILTLDTLEKYRILGETPASEDDSRGVISKLDLRLLEHELQNASAEHDLDQIRQRPDQNLRPVSFDQQSLWLTWQLDKQSVTYNNPMVLHLNGPLDPAVLQRGLSMIEQRHEALRTSFHYEEGEPHQVIGEARERPMILVDFGALDEAEKQSRLSQLIRHEAAMAFDLEHGPIWRIILARLRQDQYVLMFTMHHICSDAWSMRLFVDEISKLYEYYAVGGDFPLPALPIQYADYAWWQRRYLEANGKKLADFWKDYLAGVSFDPILGADNPRPERQSYNGAMHNVRYSEQTTRALEALSKENEATLFMTILAAFSVVLRHESGRQDFVVGTDLANRDRPETSDLIGYFINQLVLRCQLDGNPTLTELIQRVSQNALPAFAHREMPFEQVVKEVGVVRNPAYAPLFQTKFFMVHEEREVDMPGIRLEPLPPGKASARIDLTLGLWHGEREISGWLNYNTDLFEPRTIERIAGLLDHTLSIMVERPETPLSDVLDDLNQFVRAQRESSAKARRRGSAKKFQRGKRRIVSIDSNELVRFSPLNDPSEFIRVIEPQNSGLDIASWATENQSLVQDLLKKHGALLFRGFDLGEVNHFQRFANTVINDIYKDNAEHQPVSDDGAVQTPVDYAADQFLLWHNENSFNWQWPRKILFACAVVPESGGQTPLVDSRLFYERIDPAIRKRFAEKGVMYVRNMTGMLGLSWQQIFQTEDRARVEQQCHEAKLEFEWNGDQYLRTRAIRPGVIQHPETGIWSWFNQAQHWHVSCLDEATRASVAQVFDEVDYPRNCYFGDGSKIEDGIMDEILGLYRELEVHFPWQRGDAMLVDNVAAAHARRPYTGPRKILVSQGDMNVFSDSQMIWRNKR